MPKALQIQCRPPSRPKFYSRKRRVSDARISSTLVSLPQPACSDTCAMLISLLPSLARHNHQHHEICRPATLSLSDFAPWVHSYISINPLHHTPRRIKDSPTLPQHQPTRPCNFPPSLPHQQYPCRSGIGIRRRSPSGRPSCPSTRLPRASCAGS
jgi:hypothetical protein